ncbi:hypothetical protein LEN26_018655 [Aphanomyces euteiches]|nr:hypothetical protein LEN26_018655 [Aphanomyces euteiches]
MVSLRWLVAFAALVAPTLQQSCSSIENDVDYSGNDLRSVGASSAADCCAKCSAASDCNAFSYAWNTCYFKSTKGGTAAKSGVQSGTVSRSNSCASIESDVDYPGNDLRSVPANAAEDCCDICSGDASCKAFSYAWNTCYLKSSQGTPVAKAGIRSGTVSKSGAQCSSIENNVDYSGNDLYGVTANAAEDCCALCSAAQGCKAFSFFEKTCYLKSGKGSATSKAGVQSATLGSSTPSTPSTCPTIEDDTDYDGGGLQSVTAGAAEDCCAICKATKDCKLFAFGYNTCYLKSSQGQRVSKPGIRAAIIVPSSLNPTQAPTTAPTPKPTTAAPYACNKPRQRQAWSSLSQADKDLYISAVEVAMKRGLFQRFLSVHNDMRVNNQAHSSCVFLFWHRKFIFAYENMLRSLDPKYACLTLAYWDYTQDYVGFQKKKCSTILDCSLAAREMGGSTQGVNPQKLSDGHTSLCVNTRPLSSYDGGCVNRGDWHKTTMPMWGISSVRSALFDHGNSIFNVSYYIELGIHGSVHMNLRSTMMSGFYSPMDPIFYLHHSMVDLIHTIFYHCKVENLNLDDKGQQTNESSFKGCTIKYNDGTQEEIGPNTKILVQSHKTVGDNTPIPIEQDDLIGRYFEGIPSEYYKLTDPRTLGYTYKLGGLIGDLYASCGQASASSTESAKTESATQSKNDHEVAPLVKQANIETVDFQLSIVALGISQGLTNDQAYAELKKIALLLHVNCFNGGEPDDYPPDFQKVMSIHESKPEYVLWQQLKSHQTKVEITGWEKVALVFYNCSGALNV